MSSTHIKIVSPFLVLLFLLANIVIASAADTSPVRGGATFGEKPIFQSSSDIQYVLSPGRNALTILFGPFFEAIATSSSLPTEVARRARSNKSEAPVKSEGPVATRTFSIVLPLTSEKPIRTPFFASGFAFTGPDSGASLVFVINGQQKVVRFGPSTEKSFVEKLDFRAARTNEIRMTLFLLAERNSSNPDATSFLRVDAIDADTVPAQRRTPGQTKK